jgi:PAS domain S-box-containing protein
MSLLQKNEDLDQFFNISLDLLCIANTDGYFLRLNPAWERIFGYSREELMTKRFFDFVHPDDRDATLKTLSLLTAQHDIVHFENRYRCKDGAYRWLDWALAPAGAFIYATARDVTDRKQAEESLKERLGFETLLSEISAEFINLPAEQIDIAIQDTQARICEFLHLERSTLWQACQNDPRSLVLTHIHQPSGSTPPPEWQTAEDLLPWVTQKILNGEVVAISSLAELPPEAGRDRESLQFYKTKSTVGVPLSVGEGPVFGLLSFAVMREERDWSETVVTGFRLIAQVVANALARKRADRELRDSEARLSLAADAAGAGLWIFYLDTDDVWVSQTTRELFHFAPDEKVTNNSFFKAIHPDDHDRVRQAVQQALHSGEKLKFDYRIVLPDGSIRWLVAHGQRYPATKPVCLMGVSLDITERLNAEAEARQQWEQLAHVTRIGIMGELTASLAHEINQPLTAIQSNADAAQRFLSRPEPDIDEVRQILGDIIRDDTRASDIIRKIRALLKREAAAFAVLDLNDLIRDVLSLLRADSLLRDVGIDAEVFPALPPVLGDRIQLQQVIINLILNGAAAMKNTPPDRRKLIIKTAIQEDRSLEVSVADSGTGIDESAMAHLFEPFYTTKSEGLGMGLAISRTIIRAHGGTLEASNNPEGGATFALTLPAYQGDSA